jgi:hypothetical protein
MLTFFAFSTGSIAAPGPSCQTEADARKLAGAARTGFLKKCERDAAGVPALSACEKSAADKKLSGAAKTSHIKKCVADAGAPKSNASNASPTK